MGRPPPGQTRFDIPRKSLYSVSAPTGIVRCRRSRSRSNAEMLPVYVSVSRLDTPDDGRTFGCGPFSIPSRPFFVPRRRNRRDRPSRTPYSRGSLSERDGVEGIDQPDLGNHRSTRSDRRRISPDHGTVRRAVAQGRFGYRRITPVSSGRPDDNRYSQSAIPTNPLVSLPKSMPSPTHPRLTAWV